MFERVGVLCACVALAVFIVATQQIVVAADYADGLNETKRIDKSSEPQRLKDAVLLWRRAAWRNDDFLAAVKLAEVYDKDSQKPCGDDASCTQNEKLFGGRSVGANLRVEAYVWYYLATQSERLSKYLFNSTGQREIALKLDAVSKSATRLFMQMSEAERSEARLRMTYIMSCQGPDGFIRLATLYNDTHAHVGDPGLKHYLGRMNTYVKGIRGFANVKADDPLRLKIGLDRGQAFSTDKFAALLFLYIARDRGSDLAGKMADDLAAEIGSETHAKEVENNAQRWVPPFEFYPRPHTDECVRSADEERKLAKIANYVDPDEIRQALWFLQYLVGSREQWPVGLARAIIDFQTDLMHDKTGKLTPEEILRLIQMAAVNGHTASQVRLGVLYAKGQALRSDYQRAANWFATAAKQRDGQAMYYLGEMVKKGYIYDETPNSAAALSFYMQAAIAGYGPNKQRFKELLDAGPCQDCNRSTTEPLPQAPKKKRSDGPPASESAPNTNPVTQGNAPNPVTPGNAPNANPVTPGNAS